MAMAKAQGELKKTRLPPKRGQIKVRIISIIIESVLRVASKAGRGLQRKKVASDSEEMQLPKTK